MSEWQDGDLRFETVDSYAYELVKGWHYVIDHQTSKPVAAFPSAADALTYTARLNQAYTARHTNPNWHGGTYAELLPDRSRR